MPACWRMGSGYEWKKVHPRAAVHRRCWPTSTCTTYLTCGFNRGVENKHTVMSLSCALQTTSSLDSRCQAVLGRTEGTNAEVRPRTASRENAPTGVRTICDPGPPAAWRRET